MKKLAAILVAIGLFAAGAFAQSVYPIQTTLRGDEKILLVDHTTGGDVYTTVSAVRDGRGYIYQAPTTGFTIAMTVAQSAVSLNPAGTLATGTITLPPTATDGKMVSIWSSQTITALTLNTSNGATITNPVTTISGGAAAVSYLYSLSSNAWRRIS